MSAEPFFAALRARFVEEADRLNALDAAIGDGDHGATMLRGLTKAAAAESGARARAFMRASGGASGTLFGLVLLEIEAHLDTGAPLQEGLARAWKQINGGQRANDESRFEAENLAFHEKVRAGYLELARLEPDRFRIIDAARDVRQVRSRIYDVLALFLDPH